MLGAGGTGGFAVAGAASTFAAGFQRSGAVDHTHCAGRYTGFGVGSHGAGTTPRLPAKHILVTVQTPPNTRRLMRGWEEHNAIGTADGVRRRCDAINLRFSLCRRIAF